MKTPKIPTLFLVGQIEEKSIEIIAELFSISRANSKTPINLFLSSGGGEEDSGFAIFDAIRGIPNEVRIFGYGQVSSIAALIFQAGDKRYLSPNSVYMMHNGSVVINDTIDFDKIEELSNFYKANNKRYYAAISGRTGKTDKEIEKLCGDEKFFSATEAVEAGFADSICEELLKCGKN